MDFGRKIETLRGLKTARTYVEDMSVNENADGDMMSEKTGYVLLRVQSLQLTTSNAPESHPYIFIKFSVAGAASAPSVAGP